MGQSISILGCGWLGLPLAKKFISLGYEVKGSTTTPEKIFILHDSNIIPYQMTFNPSVEGDSVADFFKSDVLFVNIPFSRGLKDPWFYFEQMRSVIDHIVAASLKRVVFASSTAVYPELNQTAKEEDCVVPSNERAKVLLQTEQLFLNDQRFATTVLRFAGLYGPGREIGKFLKALSLPIDASAPVNLIHLDDCIGAVVGVIQKGIHGIILNACCDEHPLRRDLYTQAALAAGLTPPVFQETSQSHYKIVDNSRLKELLEYQFIYPNPLDWIRQNRKE